MDEDPLQCCIQWPGQQAVCGETAAGDCGEGKVDSTEDPVKGSRGRDVHSSQQASILQPERHCLQQHVVACCDVHHVRCHVNAELSPLSSDLLDVFEIACATVQHSTAQHSTAQHNTA